MGNMLDELSQTKREYLNDDHQREMFKEKLRKQKKLFDKMYTRILGWCQQKEEYLITKESINSISAGQSKLSSLLVYDDDKNNMLNGLISSFKKLGEEIKTDKYQSAHSNYSYPEPDEIVT